MTNALGCTARIHRLREAGYSVPPRILLAEDDPEMRRLLTGVLERDGYEIIGASDGDELLRRLRVMRDGDALPDLVVSDIRMPGATGFAVLESIEGAGLSVPVILMSAFCDSRVVARAEHLGAYCVLSKPFDMDLLRNAVLCVLVGGKHGDAIARRE